MKTIFILSCLNLLMSSCSTSSLNSLFKSHASETLLDYDSFIDNQIEYKTLFSVAKEGYFVYFYSLYCLHCKNIKEDILRFLSLHEDCFYLLMYTEDIPIVDDISFTIGKDDFLYFGIKGTPTLIYIYNRKIEMNICGEDIIRTFLNSSLSI